MNALRIVIMLLVGSAGFGFADEDAPALKQYPYKANFFWDGGTFFLESNVGEEPKKAFCFDFRTGSATKGEFYAGGRHPKDKGAKMLTAEEASIVFTKIESKLSAYHGKKEFESIQANVRRLVSGHGEVNTQSQEILDTQYILGKIEEYRNKRRQNKTQQSKPR